MRHVRVLLLAAAFAGCAPFNPANMTPEQLTALAKIKDATVTCIIANSPYGKGSGLYLSLDKGVIPTGTMTVDDGCKVTITTAPAPRP